MIIALFALIALPCVLWFIWACIKMTGDGLDHMARERAEYDMDMAEYQAYLTAKYIAEAAATARASRE